MERQYYITEQSFRWDLKYNVHVVTISDKHKGGMYQSIISMNAFEDRIRTRWFDSFRHKYPNSNPKYHKELKSDIERRDINETFYHNSLKDFYNFIHYDPKRAAKSKPYLDGFMVKYTK